jgi:hypothetical protein
MIAINARADVGLRGTMAEPWRGTAGRRDAAARCGG